MKSTLAFDAAYVPSSAHAAAYSYDGAYHFRCPVCGTSGQSWSPAAQFLNCECKGGRWVVPVAQVDINRYNADG